MPRYSLSIGGKKIPIAETDRSLSKSIGRRLAGSANTEVASGGSINSYTFDGQEITQNEMREIKEIRESGGVISRLVRLKALLMFGGGVRFEVPNNEETTEVVNGEETTLKDYLQSEFDTLAIQALEIGEDSIWYPFGAAEIRENQVGEFKDILPVQPWTLQPETDAQGEIVQWTQYTENNPEGKALLPDEIVHFPITKASARDKTGISEVLRNKEEIEQFRNNQQAIKNAIELHAFPQRHVKVGAEDAAPIRDNELRRVRTLFDSRTTDSDTVYVTGQDVNIDALEAENFDFEKVTENDLKQLALAFGLPVEAANVGSDGLGSGMPAELRMNLLKLEIKATRRLYTNIWTRDILTPIIRKYTPFDHTVKFDLEMKETVEGMDDMASIIQQVGDYMETNEARELLNLEPKDDLEGEYGKPDDATPEGDGSLFSDSRALAVPAKYTDGTGLSEDDFIPNESILDVINPTLEFIDEHGLPNPDAQREGAARINQLKNHIEANEPLDPEFWQEIHNFHKRHRAQGNHQCDESTLPEQATEIDNSEFDKCHFDNGWFSDRTWGGDPAFEQSKRIVKAIEETDGVELGAGCAHKNSTCTHELSAHIHDETPDWDKHFMEMHDRVFEADGDTRLLDLQTEQSTPEFVKERIRSVILESGIFQDMETVSANDLMDVREFMLETLQSDGWTMDGLADQIEQVVDDPADAMKIARTESHAIIQKAREEGYQERGQEDDRFYWTGSTDRRTTDICKYLIKGNAANLDNPADFQGLRKPNGTNPFEGGTPMGLEELKRHVQEVSIASEEFEGTPREWTPHINCRKTYARAPTSPFGEVD